MNSRNILVGFLILIAFLSLSTTVFATTTNNSLTANAADFMNHTQTMTATNPVDGITEIHVIAQNGVAHKYDEGPHRAVNTPITFTATNVWPSDYPLYVYIRDGEPEWVQFQVNAAGNVISGPTKVNVTFGVGGYVIPVDKFSLLAPYIGVASVSTVAAVATLVYFKRVERRREE